MNLQKANGETLYQFYDIVGIFFTIGRTLKPNLNGLPMVEINTALLSLKGKFITVMEEQF